MADIVSSVMKDLDVDRNHAPEWPTAAMNTQAWLDRGGECYTYAQTAAYLGVSVPVVRLLVERCHLEVSIVAGRIRVPRHAVSGMHENFGFRFGRRRGESFRDFLLKQVDREDQVGAFAEHFQQQIKEGEAGQRHSLLQLQLHWWEKYGICPRNCPGLAAAIDEYLT